MNKELYIYDFEVYSHDWFMVARQPESKEYVIIHNNNHQIKEFIKNKNLVLGGFNSKFYDDAICNSINYGADNETVKKLNDFIIVDKRMWWDFPFLNYKKKEFMSFDLRDDLPLNLSLKAIEGNMGGSIVETGVSFNINRPLNKEEIKKTIAYCKVDVDKSIELYKERLSYLDSKRSVARIKGMDEYEAMCLTNAKLTAAFLDAKLVKRSDEVNYPIPDTLDIGAYQHVLDFFNDPVTKQLEEWETKREQAKTERQRASLTKKIDSLKKSKDIYETKLTTKVAGVNHVYAWGGIHGARTKYVDHSDDRYNIVTIDVASYYPSMMLEYDYISRNIPSKQGYADIYHKRMKAKAEGDSFTSDALKLVLNTCYGAMKNQYNDLYDPRNANAICVGGQLLLTDLIDKLESIPEFKLMQSNTDGIIIKYPRKHEAAVFKIVGKWEKRTRMKMEYTDIHNIAQKDVNNYVLKSGQVYTVENGVKNVQKEDKGYIQTKGGYVSLHRGGDFKNKNLVVLHKALVEFFMNGVPVEETINNETDISKFQIIAKTGSTYSGTYHEVNGQQVDVQNVNRVYATTNKVYGTIKKLKPNGRTDKIAGLPDHAVIDNDATMTLDQIDKSFYIETAKSRIVDYVGKNYKQEDVKMTQKKNAPEVEKVEKEETKVLGLYEKISKVRTEFHQDGTKKTGSNDYAEYMYFTLEDIIPKVRSLNDKYNLTTLFNFTPELATLTVIDNDAISIAKIAPFDININMISTSFASPMATQAMPKGGTEVQHLGAVQTYLRRYLYFLYLDLVEQDVVEETSGMPDKPTKKEDPAKKTVKASATKKSNRPVTPKEREAAKDNVIDKKGEASATQINSIKKGLSKLRTKDESYEDYIKEVIKDLRAGVDKKKAEALLIEISEKVAE